MVGSKGQPSGTTGPDGQLSFFERSGWRCFRELGNVFEMNFSNIQAPCIVQIENPRLRLCQLGMQISVIVACSYLFIHDRLWEGQVEPIGSTSFWLEMGSSHAAGVEHDLQNAKFCDSSKKKDYDYQYDSEGLFKYTDISCKALGTREAGVKGDTQPFVPTFMEETFVDTVAVQDLLEDGICTAECDAQNVRPGDNYKAADRRNSFGECVCESSTEQDHFIAGAEDVKIGIEFAAEVNFPGYSGTDREHYSQKKADDNVLTLVRDEDGQILRTIPPGTSLVFQLRELLEFANVDLEDDFTATAPNQLADATRIHPALRQTGLDLTLQLSCHNVGDRSHKQEHDGPVCYATVHAERKWNSRPTTNFDVPTNRRGIGNYRSRYIYGVSVKFQITGSFQYLTGSKMFSFFSSVIVYMSMPQMIIMVIALSLMGPLSQIYDASRTTYVNIDRLTWGAISRAVHRSLAYDQFLEIQKKVNQKESCLTANTIERSVCKLFNCEDFDMDAGEIKAMTESYLEGMDKNGDRQIMRQEFIKYAGSEEAVTLPILAKMYDLDWDRGVMQRIFDHSLTSRRARLDKWRKQFQVIHTFNGEMGIDCGEDGTVLKVIDHMPAFAKGIKAGHKIVKLGDKRFSKIRLNSAEKSGSDYDVSILERKVLLNGLADDRETFYTSEGSLETYESTVLDTTIDFRKLFTSRQSTTIGKIELPQHAALPGAPEDTID